MRARGHFTVDLRHDSREQPLFVSETMIECTAGEADFGYNIDVIAPPEVGDFVHREIAGSKLVRLRATGHCPNLSAPDETVAAVARYHALGYKAITRVWKDGGVASGASTCWLPARTQGFWASGDLR